MDKITLEQLTQKQQNQLQTKIPVSYNINEYINDLSSFYDQIEDVIEEAEQYVINKDYQEAGDAYSTAANLLEIYQELGKGHLHRANYLIEGHNQKLEYYMPERLYDSLPSQE
ncbi:hypothetical protein SMSP2_01779 [Limihaloglobus sulfuriphilus]|uniref:Uncharacterized protein n=1 Tax=Limihaloglobus sulfuriphilus TaxID=1851148 RepID=A0A1Q2MFC0_9BACT|nr:hypothetical protein [Limihaloglobus sulfuriphilus]AQQ71405.1 hypothetical protein SMSP2_01779 [Limihaloglobus sulfuriphilus]